MRMTWVGCRLKPDGEDIDILRISDQTRVGTGTFGSNLRADTLDCIICLNACSLFALAPAVALPLALAAAALAKAIAVGANVDEFIIGWKYWCWMLLRRPLS